MMTTKAWAESFNICGEKDVPAISGYDEPSARSPREVATRVLILQGIAAVAYGVDPQPIVEWFRQEGLWDHVTPHEQGLLANPESSGQEEILFRWKQEAEWTLLWALGKVESLGLPTHFCDTARLVDEIIPPLGEDVAPFIDGARLRPPGKLLAEDDRTYDLWCCASQAHRRGEGLPDDLNVGILRERRYAFEWLSHPTAWDEVTCDA